MSQSQSKSMSKRMSKRHEMTDTDPVAVDEAVYIGTYYASVYAGDKVCTYTDYYV